MFTDANIQQFLVHFASTNLFRPAIKFRPSHRAYHRQENYKRNKKMINLISLRRFLAAFIFDDCPPSPPGEKSAEEKKILSE